MAVEFNEDEFNQAPKESPVRQESGITGMLIKNGIVKNARQANYLMIATIVVLLCVIAYFTL